MTKTKLNLADIQGNVVRAYGSFGYSTARYFFLHVAKNRYSNDFGRQGVGDPPPTSQDFISWLIPDITTSQRWNLRGKERSPDRIDPPDVTLNIGFTFGGLARLGLPTLTLSAMPDEFIDGMKKRAPILGDIDHNDPRHWDKIWRDDDDSEEDNVHIWISMNARGASGPDDPVPELEEKTKWLRKLVDDSKGAVRILPGIGPDDNDFQDARAQFVETKPGVDRPTRKEHFGFADGFGNPVFEGQFDPKVEDQVVVGRGKLQPDQTWEPLKTGEFVLGHTDESQQLPTQARPWELTHNGTFMVYRKLHQNVKSFNDYIDQEAVKYASVMGVPKDEAMMTIKAKMAGRWPDGIPLMVAPTFSDWEKEKEKWKGKTQTPEHKRMLMDFKYGDDMEGQKCPLTAHMRRANTRDMLDPSVAPGSKDSSKSSSTLNKRRRILRRGLPYGPFGENDDNGEHGTIFMVVCASIFRQFEFVQQQWIQYGLDFNAGNDTCPLLGNHDGDAKFVIPSSPESGKPPYICAGLPNFVTTRGGDYFFIPSLNALNMIAKGIVDPT